VRPLLDFWLKYRKRLAPFVILVGLVVVGGTVFDASPRETEIRYDLGPGHGEVREARIVYVTEGEEVKGVRFQWDDGAPPSLRHTVELSPGRYDIRADVVGRGGPRSIRRALRVPADGVVRIDLFDQAVAQRLP